MRRPRSSSIVATGLCTFSGRQTGICALRRASRARIWCRCYARGWHRDFAPPCGRQTGRKLSLASAARRSGATATRPRSGFLRGQCRTTARTFCSLPSRTGLNAKSRRGGGDSGRSVAGCAARAGAGRHPQGTRKHDPRARRVEPGIQRHERRGAVDQRGIPIDQRGIGNLAGRITVAERGIDHHQHPASRDLGTATRHRRRSAKHPEQLEGLCTRIRWLYMLWRVCQLC